MNSICVYCGSSGKIDPTFTNAAYEMGTVIAAEGIQLIYGAGSTGLMGAVANGALENGGDVVGVIPELFNTPTLAHKGLTRLEIVPDMHVRKARMAELSDAFIALPGGMGTFEEILEMVTWAQIGFHTKPCGVLNICGYYDKLFAFLDNAVKERFIRPEHRDMLMWDVTPKNLFEQFLKLSKKKILQQNYWLAKMFRKSLSV